MEAPPPEPELSQEERIAKLINVFEEVGVSVLRPESITPEVSFIKGSVEYVSEEDWINVQNLLDSFLKLCDEYDGSRMFMWIDEGKVNFGIMVHVEEVLELHCITFNLTL